MQIKKWKEINPKEKGIILFTVLSILLIIGVFFYQSFAIFKTNENQDMIEGNVENMGDLEFAFFIDGELSPTAPAKEKGYSLDTSSSYCKDMKTGQQISRVSWNQERWSAEVKDITNTKTKCFLNFKKIYKETELNEAIPDLMNGRLVPIVISDTYGPSGIEGSSGGKVTKADITDEENPWYKYADKKWANAVILKEGVTDTYQPGEEILQSDIESYFVWIPRYKYTLQDEESTFNSFSSATDLGFHKNVQSVYETMKEKNKEGNIVTNHGFEIEFGSKDRDISTTLLSKGTSIVHPAFIAFDTNGLWVGKFETGYNQNSDESVMPSNAESWKKEDAVKNIEASNKVIIKPSVYSWRGINVSNAFYTSYEYKRELESHMMKNTEWGAVAYLAHSQYGRCDHNSQNCSEVRINNVSTHITGSSAINEPTCGNMGSNELCNKYEAINQLYIDGSYSYNYYNKESKEASTTGNYSGIYDMSGGAWEYVMGVMQAGENNNNPASGANSTNNSGFKGPYSEEEGENDNGLSWPSRKYYDLYDYNISNQEYKRGILGDATKEMGPFYSVNYTNTNALKRNNNSYFADDAIFVNNANPWFRRGDYFGFGCAAGITAFGYEKGASESYTSFRIVLAL